MSSNELHQLLALKRHEGPPEGYMEDFLHEFHARRREEAITGTGWSGLWQRLTGRLADSTASKWVYGAGFAYATATLLFVTTSRESELVAPPLEAAGYQIEVSEPVEPAAAESAEDSDQAELEGVSEF